MLDVLIAGAGPAGAIAATVLARAGARVLVLERARFPRAKLCGDTLNPGALAVLERLGLGSAIGPSIPLAGMIVTGNDGIRVEGRYAGVTGRAIARRDLDWALLMAAAGAGARIEQGVLVQGPLVDSSGHDVALPSVPLISRPPTAGPCACRRASSARPTGGTPGWRARLASRVRPLARDAGRLAATSKTSQG